MDKSKYTYLPTDHGPNVLVPVPLGSSKPIPLLMSSGIFRSVIQTVAKRKPKWVLAPLSGYHHNGNIAYFSSVMGVYEDGHLLGRLISTSTHGGAAVGVDNPRMARNRQRGSYTSTSDEKKAVRLVLSNFYLPSPNEVLVALRTEAMGAMQAQHSARAGAYHQQENALKHALLRHALRNWDDAMRALGTSAEQFATFQEDRAAALSASDMYGALGVGGRTTLKAELVTIQNGSYYVSPYNVGSTGDATQVFTSDTLDEARRVAIGKLKLMENKGDVVLGVGVKLSETSFLIYTQR